MFGASLRDGIERTAKFSPCSRYRYALWRRWAAGPHVLFVCLNPSTADETTDDPTVRRCMGFARQWGYGGVCIANLFAWRATEPADMMAAPDPVGPDNDSMLKTSAQGAGLIVAAWGNGGAFMPSRVVLVCCMFPTLHALKITAAGHPAHPLYLRRDLKPKPWVGGGPAR